MSGSQDKVKVQCLVASVRLRCSVKEPGLDHGAVLGSQGKIRVQCLGARLRSGWSSVWKPGYIQGGVFRSQGKVMVECSGSKVRSRGSLRDLRMQFRTQKEGNVPC